MPTPTPTPSVTTAAPAAASGAYLALGDSVPFGFYASATVRRPETFRGYPEVAAPVLRRSLTNASCPGETTASFISHHPGDWCSLWRAAAPLHVGYRGAQLAYALGFLRDHPLTRLVSLTIGANDLLTCDGRGLSACRSRAVAQEVLQVVERRLTRIVADLRTVYRGPLVLVTYYSTDYRDTQETLALQRLNAVAAAVVRRYGGSVADGFEAFRRAAGGGDACAAGLLARLPAGGCDIHPSARGTGLLASALVAAARRAGG